MSLRLMFSMDVVGEGLVHDAGEGAQDDHYETGEHRAHGAETLNQGLTRYCDETEMGREAPYCEWERYFEEDVARALRVSRSRVEVLAVGLVFAVPAAAWSNEEDEGGGGLEGV